MARHDVEALSAPDNPIAVAEIAGHVRIETTRRYSLPSKADRQAAMERMDVEF